MFLLLKDLLPFQDKEVVSGFKRFFNGDFKKMSLSI